MYSLTLVDIPGRQDGQRHHEGGQHDEQDRNPVDAHLVAQPHDPGMVFDELKAGIGRIEPEQHVKRDQEGRRGAQSAPAIWHCGRRLVIAAQEHGHDQRR
jgi:hypothetical protein